MVNADSLNIRLSNQGLLKPIPRCTLTVRLKGKEAGIDSLNAKLLIILTVTVKIEMPWRESVSLSA